MAECELVVNHDKCTGCRICEVACSMHHGWGASPQKSMISIVALEGETTVVYVPVKCMQCEKPPCEAVCPTGAISSDLTTGAKLIDVQKCIGCSACAYVCPFGAAVVDRTTGAAHICDLCDGDPFCARLCSSGALRYIATDEVSIRRKRERTDRLLDYLDPSSDS